MVPAVVGSREVDTHKVLDFGPRVMAVAIFRGLQAETVYIRFVMFAVRIMMGHACGIIHVISVGRQDISGMTAPIEDPARLEFQDQVLSSSGLVDMEDRIRRQGRLWFLWSVVWRFPHPQESLYGLVRYLRVA